MAEPGEQPKLSGMRMLEAIIIAVAGAIIAALASSYLTVTTLRVEMDHIRDEVRDTKAEVRDLRSVVYRPSWEPGSAATIQARPDGVAVRSRVDIGDTPPAMR